MMPDLPNVGLERDIEQFIVSNQWGICIYAYALIDTLWSYVGIL